MTYKFILINCEKKITACLVYMCNYRMQQLKQKAEALSAILVYETPDYPSDNDSCNGSSPTPPTSSTPPITKMDPFFKYKVIISYPKVLK